MDKEKYYTPKLEEFHVGFEYEVKQSTDPKLEDWQHSWRSEILDKSNIKYLLSRLDNNMFRIKYLDKEDIESLDLKSIKNGNSKNSPLKFRFKKSHPYEDFWYLLYYEDTKLCVIDNNEDYDSNCTLFYGYINNKSELKKLIQLLKI